MDTRKRLLFNVHILGILLIPCIIFPEILGNRSTNCTFEAEEKFVDSRNTIFL